jgi:hypothetical protein
VAYRGSALNARATGPWQECGEGEIDWTDFDEQTISCVLQYLYTQEYNASQAVQLLEKKFQSDAAKGQGYPFQEDKGGPSGIPGAIRVENAVAGSTTLEQQSPGDVATEDLIDRPLTPLSCYLETSLSVEHDPTTGGNSSQAMHDDAPSELLVHAKVYSFAHRYFVDDLKQFVLRRLKQILTIIQKKQLGFCPQLAESISFVYDATFASSAREDPARNLFSQFVALNYTAMYGSRLKRLLIEGGPFPADLCWKLARRLMSNPLEERINELTTAYESLQAEVADEKKEIQRLTRELQEWDDWNSSQPPKRRRSIPSRNNNTFAFWGPTPSSP